MGHLLDRLLEQANNKWVPNWFENFSDNINGGFYERLDSSNQPIDLPKRLLTQCRQLIVYCNASKNSEKYRSKIDEGFQFILDNYHVKETGGFVFRIKEDGCAFDVKYDLYAHAFFLLSCASYYETTKNSLALEYAESTFNFIEQNFKISNTLGYLEVLDKELHSVPSIRRQNPHMHLLEACLALYKTSQSSIYLEKSHDLMEIFISKFYDEEHGILREFFDNELKPHDIKGDLIEAGHHSEWVWLLKQYQDISESKDPRIDSIIKKLFSWILENGIDKEHGGVFNVQNPDGTVIDSNKRIWTTMETIRAASIMMNDDEYKHKSWEIIDQLSILLESNYLDKETGDWKEVLNQNLEPITDYRPGTTPYHIYPVLKETVKYLSQKF